MARDVLGEYALLENEEKLGAAWSQTAEVLTDSSLYTMGVMSGEYHLEAPQALSCL